MRHLFMLDPDVTYLNHGAFGACPQDIFEAYQKYQVMLERQPTDFTIITGPSMVEQSKKVLGQYINAEAADLIFVHSPTYAVNVIANTFVNQGDEILTTNLEYGGCDRTWRYFCKQRGASYVQAPITLPLESVEKFVEEFFAHCTPKTKMIFISEITSMTALILPVKEICAEAKRRGILTFVDGAHSIGQIDIDLVALDADFYTAACHKWLLTPKGCSFLFTKNEHHHKILPFVVSWGYESPWPSGSTYQDYLQFIGTRDFSAFLTVADALQFRQKYNWLQVSKDCQNRTHKWLQTLCNLMGSQPLAPITSQYIGQMGSIPIKHEAPTQLKSILIDKYKIEIPVFVQNGQVYIRYSLNGYNSEQDMERLQDALKKENISFQKHS